MNRTRIAAAGAVIALVVGGVWWLWPPPSGYTITARFTTSTGLYTGDQVTVLGVPIGKVGRIRPHPSYVEIALHIDHNVKLPAAAQAAIVSQSLVASRTVELSPAYGDGPQLAHGATIGVDRTLVPMEWDDIKKALADISTQVGPKGPADPGSVAQVVNSASNAIGPNAPDIHDTITQLSTAMTTISDGRGDLFAVVRNLQLFVTAMHSSDSQITDLQQRLATVTSVLGHNDQVLGQGVSSVDQMLGDVEDFLSRNRDLIVKNVSAATDLTTVLHEQRENIEGLLHQAPTQVANFYNLYKPALGVMSGVFSAPNFENPIQAVCGGFAAAAQPHAQRDTNLCLQYMGAYLNTLKTSYPDILTDPTRGSFTDPGQQIASVPGVMTSVPGLTGAPPAQTTVPKTIADLLLPAGQR